MKAFLVSRFQHLPVLSDGLAAATCVYLLMLSISATTLCTLQSKDSFLHQALHWPKDSVLPLWKQTTMV